jgi:hypothetical protein
MSRIEQGHFSASADLTVVTGRAREACSIAPTLDRHQS